jgi:hypothetical protein
MNRQRATSQLCLLARARPITYKFTTGNEDYFKSKQQLLEREKALNEERAVEWAKFKDVPVDPNDFTTGPKPWLNPFFPSNQSLLPVELGYNAAYCMCSLPSCAHCVSCCTDQSGIPHTLESAVPFESANDARPSYEPLFFKSKMSFKLEDLQLSELEQEVFKLLVGSQRYNATTDTVTFVAKHFASRQANENRVYQYLDSCMHYSKTLAERFQKERSSTQETTS